MSKSEDSVPKSRLGPPVWVESLLTDAEHRELCIKWPETNNRPMYKVADRNKHTVWRSSTITAQETAETNARIESLKQYHLSKQKENE